MEPVLLQPTGSGRQIDSPHLTGFLSVEFVAGDAAEPVAADQFMSNPAERRGIGDDWDG